MVSKSKGFTLVELMISIAIAAIIMSVVLFNYSGFNDNLALSSAGQEVAIAVRQAEVYGLSVKEVSVGSGNFNSGYGIDFSEARSGDYILFVDKNGNNLYDGNGGCGTSGSECITDFKLQNNVVISQICDDQFCPPSSATAVDVTFLRPDPDALIKFINAGGPISSGGALEGKIILTSPKGKNLTVDIESTGQISVQ